MHLTTLTLTFLSFLPSSLALDYIATYNLLSARWDANLIDTPNNITCSITYEDTSSLLIADANGYLSSPIAIVVPCGDVNYIATTVVGVDTSVVSYVVPGEEVTTFETGSRILLGDGEVVQMVYGA